MTGQVGKNGEEAWLRDLENALWRAGSRDLYILQTRTTESTLRSAD